MQFTDDGLGYMLKIMLGEVFHPQEPFQLHLYVNNFSPDENSTLLDFEECSLLGYAIETLALGDYSFSAAGQDALADHANLVYDFPNGNPSGVTLYGYFLTNFVSDVLIGAELFVTPIPVNPSGDTFTFHPFWDLAQGV